MQGVDGNWCREGMVTGAVTRRARKRVQTDCCSVLPSAPPSVVFLALPSWQLEFRHIPRQTRRVIHSLRLRSRESQSAAEPALLRSTVIVPAGSHPEGPPSAVLPVCTAQDASVRIWHKYAKQSVRPRVELASLSRQQYLTSTMAQGGVAVLRGCLGAGAEGSNKTLGTT